MAVDLKAGLVRIFRSDGKTTSGAGFVVSDKGLLATCSHVVQPEASQKKGDSRPEKVVLVFSVTGEQMAARFLPDFWRPADGEDVAILQLEGDLPAAVRPLPLGSSEGTSNHAFQTFGFPESGPEDGSFGDGHILNQLSMRGTRVLQVSSPQVTPGFSGGPVLDTITGRIVGMVTAIAAPDRYGRMAETAYITPTETLQEICPLLKISDEQPYLGLAPFNEKDTRFFFGRRKTVQALVEALKSRPRLLLVMGPSGSGKSSVVQAGLIPELRKGAVPGSDKWGILLPVRLGDRPFENLEAKGLEGASKSLAEAAGQWLQKQAGAERMLLVLDQFEEFLVTCPSPQRLQFWAGLRDLLESDLPVIIMPVMRDDFYSRFALEAPPEVMEWISRGVFPVSACLEPEDLREIIEQPARQVGLALEEGLAQVIISDVLESCRDDGGKAGRSIALPLLEFALTQVWKLRGQGFLTHKAYQDVGKVSGSLTVWADEVCRSLEKDGLGQLTRRIFTDMVNLGDESQRLPDSRRRRMLDELCHQQADRDSVHRIVQRLADARLVTTSRDKGQVTVEIIHDSLIREWARLQRWLKKDRSFISWERDLEKDAQEWKDTSSEDASGRDEGSLLRGLRLSEAERWLEERKDDFSVTEIDFIHASKQFSLRRKRFAMAQKVIFVVGILFFGILILQISGMLSEKIDLIIKINDLKSEVVDLKGKYDSMIKAKNDLQNEKNKLQDRLNSAKIRGTIAKDSFIWTPQNFAGFYYDINQDLGTETLATNLTMGEMNKELSGDAPYGVTYTTTTQDKIFERDLWGSYKVIGFLGGKFFAGYNKEDGSNIFYMKSTDDNSLYKNQLEKILMDAKNEITFTSGTPLKLSEGYELAIKSIDPDGNKVYVELAKNGSVVDSNILIPFKEGATQLDKTYCYKNPLVGKQRVLVTIGIHFKNAFRGADQDLATVDGIWQISDTPIDVKADTTYDKMRIQSVDATAGIIILDNKDNTIKLGKNKDTTLMGPIKIKTANSNYFRYYIYKDNSA